MASNSKQYYLFYDFNAKINYDLGEKDKLILSSYFGSDKLRSISKEPESRTIGNSITVNTDSQLSWGNSTLTARWNHVFHKKIFLNSTFAYSRFYFNLSDETERIGTETKSEFTYYNSSIRDLSVKGDIDYFINNKHTLKTGIVLTQHTYKPKAYQKITTATNSSIDSVLKYKNDEFGFYVEDNWRPSTKLNIDVGFRLSGLSGKNYFYHYYEPRLTFSYKVFHHISTDGSYSRMNQFIHLLSNTGIGLSADLWVPVTKKAAPQQSDQLSLGAKSSVLNNTVFISLEAFRKYMRNILSYSEGATFQDLSDRASNLNWEDNITSGKGLSYGTEILIEKRAGKFTGWVGYTLSWTVHQFDSLNRGRTFFPKYDSRHNLSTLLTYKFSPKISLSAGWLFNTGNAFNIPQGFYPVNTINFNQSFINADMVPYYGARNSFRGDAYHRLDLSVKFYKKKKRFERYWEFGLFNAYNRKNTLYYYLQRTYYPDQNATIIDLKKRAFLPILPSVSYNFQF